MATVVVLNGPSSAGKTTLAQAVRARRGAGCAAIAIDDFYRMLHPGTPSNWRTFSALTDAVFAAASALAAGGMDVIVDTVFERAECLATARRALTAHTVHLVAVTCPIEILEAREHERGDRRSGQARGQHDRVFHDATYTLTLDTSALSVEECADRLAALLT